MERGITKYEERAYRLCHHEFTGLTVSEAATSMKISISKVRRLLKSMKYKAPQLFPILTKRQYLIYQMNIEFGMSQRDIAIALKTTQSNIQAIIQRMKKNGVKGLNIIGTGNTRSMKTYNSNMDKSIKQKF